MVIIFFSFFHVVFQFIEKYQKEGQNGNVEVIYFLLKQKKKHFIFLISQESQSYPLYLNIEA